MAALSLAACGDDDSVSQEELADATETAVEEAQAAEAEQEELDSLRRQLKKLKSDSGRAPSSRSVPAPTTSSSSTASGVPSDAESCGSNVYARSSTTSCSFALNVASDYFASDSNTFQTYSPVTNQTYTMSCSGGAPVICTGGNNAAVYIR